MVVGGMGCHFVTTRPMNRDQAQVFSRATEHDVCRDVPLVLLI